MKLIGDSVKMDFSSFFSYFIDISSNIEGLAVDSRSSFTESKFTN